MHCPGAGACPVTIDSHTTAGEVRPEKIPETSTPPPSFPCPADLVPGPLGLPKSEIHHLGKGCVWRD